MICRLLLAALLGGVIGLEREYRSKGAGLRTHFLVAVGAALFMLVSQYGFTIALGQLGAEGVSAHVDVSRVASQIVTGIGFIGAGTIIVQKHSIVGLTTAACVWTTAAIGVAAASGLWKLATSATLLALAGLELFRIFDRFIGRARDAKESHESHR